MKVDVNIKYKDGTIEKRKYGSQEKYDKANTKQFMMKLNLNTDKDILEWLDKQSNKQGAIKDLIREDMKK